MFSFYFPVFSICSPHLFLKHNLRSVMKKRNYNILRTFISQQYYVLSANNKIRHYPSIIPSYSTVLETYNNDQQMSHLSENLLVPLHHQQRG